MTKQEKTNEKVITPPESENKFDNEEVKKILLRIKEVKKKRADLYRIHAEKLCIRISM